MEYLNFDIEVGHRREGAYPVIVRSPAGEVQTSMRFPFEGEALEQRLKELRSVLLRFKGVPPPHLPEGQAVQHFGEQLFEALFTGEARTLYDMSCQQASYQTMIKKPETGVRIRLHLQPTELGVVPWEYLRDPRTGKDYLCLSRHTPLVRYLNLPQTLQPLKVTPPLRILGMVSSPSDLARLNVQREKERMQESLKDLEAAGLVRLKWVPGQTWQDLQQALFRGPWHIFHFIGHGCFDPGIKAGMLALADAQGKTHLLDARELGRLLTDSKELRLVILNACEGATSSDLDLFSSTAATLATRGIPAVLAMQYKITDRAAVQCGTTFYGALAAGLPVDSAVAEARKAMSLQVKNTLEWGTPVLYLRAQSSALFDLPPQPQTGQGVPAEVARLVAPSIAMPAVTPPPPPPPTPALEVLVWSIDQAAQPMRVPVQTETLTIGRVEGNDLVIPDHTVSKRHLQLTWKETAWQVTRLPGSQTVYVNGREQDQALLRPGDQLVIGGMVLRFEGAGAQGSIRNIGTEQEPLLVTLERLPHLTIIWPDGRFVVPLRGGSITIGRAPTSNVVIPLLAVSTRQAELLAGSDGSYTIKQVGTTNPLIYRGMPLQQPQRLRHGDRLYIGSGEPGKFVTLAYATPYP